MSGLSSNGEVFGATFIYGVVVALSAVVLYGMCAALVVPTDGVGRAAARPAAITQVAETVTVTATRANPS